MNEVDSIIEHCNAWVESLQKVVGTEGAYVFGSSIHRNGDQFDPLRSDLDLVLLIPSQLAFAPERSDWIATVREHKGKLEAEALRILGRENAATPIVSIVAATTVEVESDIHKSGVRDFFQKNRFRRLGKADKSGEGPLLRTCPREIDDQTRQVLGFVQGVRNKFLAISASGKASLPTWDDATDPLPKEIMRHGAIARHSSKRDANFDESLFDTQDGLEDIFHYLYVQRESSTKYQKLYQWLSVRRGARGKRLPLEPDQYLFLAEVLYDIVVPDRATVYPQMLANPVQPIEQTGTEELFSAIEVTFQVSERQRLIGTSSELSASIDEATTNLAWKRTPAFALQMAELEILDNELTGPAPTLPEDRRRRAASVHRRNQLLLAKPIITRGLHDALLYQHLLLPQRVFGKKQRSFLIMAIQVFVNRAFDVATGGTFQAWKDLSDGSQIVVEFSLPPGPQARWLGSRPESKGLTHFEQMMQLAASNPSVSELPLALIAKFFVPELLITFAHRPSQGLMNVGTIEDWSYAFYLESWKFGPR